MKENVLVLVLGFLDFHDFSTQDSGRRSLKNYPSRELLGTTGLEPTDCRGKMQSISHKYPVVIGLGSPVKNSLPQANQLFYNCPVAL